MRKIVYMDGVLDLLCYNYIFQVVLYLLYTTTLRLRSDIAALFDHTVTWFIEFEYIFPFFFQVQKVFPWFASNFLKKIRKRKISHRQGLSYSVWYLNINQGKRPRAGVIYMFMDKKERNFNSFKVILYSILKIIIYRNILYKFFQSRHILRRTRLPPSPLGLNINYRNISKTAPS